MGLFRRKDPKTSVPNEKDDQESLASLNSGRTSNASLKSPGIKGSGLPVSIPELPIAKPPDPALDPAAYLRSIHAVRERCAIVLDKTKKNQLAHFDVDMSKFSETASYVVSMIKVRGSSIVSGVWLTRSREIMPPTTSPSLPTAAGNISMSAAALASTSSFSHGPAPSTPKNEPAA